MAERIHDINLAAKWLTYVLETKMPDWLKEQMPESAEEWIDMLKGLVNLPSEEDWDEQEELDVNRFNQTIGSLRNEIVNIDPEGTTGAVVSRRSKQRDEFCKQLIRDGWVYSWDDETGYVKSGIKGDNFIKYENIEFGDHEFVKVSKLEKDFINWEVFELELKDNTKLYVASIPAWEIDLTSKVPALEGKIDHKETSKRILDPTRKRHNWQRKLDKVNKNSISSFFDSQKSFFANPVILHIPNDNFVNITLDGKAGVCEVSLSFLEEKNGEWSSFNSSKGLDSRPITIIDGQHRVRGAADAYKNFNDNILAIILPPEINENRAGKLFAEINTLSNELDKKHRLFLAHRFAVSAPQPEFDFEIYDGTGKTERARANRMAYDLAAKMLSQSKFWEKKIKVLDQNKANNQVLDIEKWMTYTYQWFESYPYMSHSSFDFVKDIVPEVLDYFDAWYETIGIENWDKSSVNNCLFKSKTQARIILKRFPQIYNDTPANYENQETKMWRRTKEDFLKTLEPLKNIPYTDELLLKTYRENALPEESWQILDSWVHDALKADKAFTKKEIMDTRNQGIFGAGIISEPPDLEENLVKFDPIKGLDPTEGEEKQITLYRPNNCFFKCKVQIHRDSVKLEPATKLTYTDSKNYFIKNKKGQFDMSGTYKIVVSWKTIAAEKEISFFVKEIKEPKEEDKGEP